MNQSEFDAHSFLDPLNAALPLLLRQAGDDLRKLRELLSVTEPYSTHMKIVDSHLKSKGWA